MIDKPPGCLAQGRTLVRGNILLQKQKEKSVEYKGLSEWAALRGRIVMGWLSGKDLECRAN